MRPIMLLGAVINASNPTYAWQNCSSPKSYVGLQQGHWGFTLHAIDYAGLSTETRCGSKCCTHFFSAVCS